MKKISAEINFTLVACFLSSLVTLVLNYNKTALTWPALDTLPAVCRLLDPKCLINDLFTSASSSLNPRLPYIYVVTFLTKIFPFGIGGGIAFLKFFNLICIPFVLTYIISKIFAFSLLEFFGEFRPKFWLITNSVAVAIVLLIQTEIGNFLSIAWWHPLTFEATPQNFSFVLILISTSLLIHFKKTFFLALVLSFFSAVIHPVFSMMALCFVLSLIFNSEKIPTMPSVLAFIIFTAFGGGVNWLLFSKSSGLTALQFIEVYVKLAHPSHYSVPELGSFTKYSWILIFSGICFLLIIQICFLYFFKIKQWKNLTLGLIFYLLSIITQYVFIEIFPNKFIALIGPSRFSMFGPWYLFIGFGYLISNLLARFKFDPALKKTLVQKVAISFITISAVFCISVSISYISRASSFETIRNENFRLYDFISTKTKLSDVFLTTFDQISIYIPLISKRAVFVGNGFPFSEKYFDAWRQRFQVSYGSTHELKNIDGSWIGEKYSNFFRSRNPNYFIKISEKYRFDWLVVGKEDSNFLNCPSSFVSEKFKLISLSGLQECLRN